MTSPDVAAEIWKGLLTSDPKALAGVTPGIVVLTLLFVVAWPRATSYVVFVGS